MKQVGFSSVCTGLGNVLFTFTNHDEQKEQGHDKLLVTTRKFLPIAVSCQVQFPCAWERTQVLLSLSSSAQRALI